MYNCKTKQLNCSDITLQNIDKKKKKKKKSYPKGHYMYRSYRLTLTMGLNPTIAQQYLLCSSKRNSSGVCKKKSTNQHWNSFIVSTVQLTWM